MLTGHGDDAYRYGDKIRLDFSSNIYSHADLNGLEDYLVRHMDKCLRHYPEPEPRELEWMLAEQFNIPRECVMVTSGVTEAIYLLAQLYSGYASIIPQPTFSEYADACEQFNHIIGSENDNLAHLPEERIYWLCNPNNPTGNVVMMGFLYHEIKRNSQYTYIVDQSYEHYTREQLFSPRDVLRIPNLVLLHSMTKQYAVPGLRLGYVTAHAAIVNRLRQLRRPWSVNALALRAGRYLVQHGKSCIPDLDTYLTEAERLRTELKQITGVRMFESKSTFMLGMLENATGSELKQYLIEEHGILIRDCSNFSGLGNQFFRVSAQLPWEDNLLVAGISEFMKDL
ncbi:MAG: aminotransferase class I/II-fold pyridoxal phosphate-dependent enzyme [Prevotella sp.]|nr:aminotransferase class I/II-fold pyridoxal phosphate-dependent enzyme [Prevotella sp.]